MGWCHGDLVTLAPHTTGCTLDTASGIAILSLGGIIVICYSTFLHQWQNVSRIGQPERSERSSVPFWCGCVAGLAMLGHVGLVGEQLFMHLHKDNHPGLQPSKLFFESSFILFYILICLMIILGRMMQAPLTGITPVAFAILCCYVIHLAAIIDEQAHGSNVSSSLLLGCVQCTVALAAVVLFKLRSKAPSSEEGIAQPLLGNAGQAVPTDRKTKPSNPWWIALGQSVAYVWPKLPGLQARAYACIFIVICVRVLNLLVPVFYGEMVDVLATATTDHKRAKPLIHTFKSLFIPWVLLYLIARFLQGGGGVGSTGLMNNLRSFLWIPISQDGERRISLQAFDHMLRLDLSFHLERKTGELIRVIDRGTSSMRVLLETMLFSIGPALLDVVCAAMLLGAREAWMAFIIFVSVAFYIPVTIVITEFRGGLRRKLNTLDNKKSAKVTDALLNYETVKYFTNEEMECENYREAIQAYQDAETVLLVSLNGLNAIQGVIMFAGVAAGMMVCVSNVRTGELTVGDAVKFLTLMSQIYAPLNFFGSYYRQIQRQMIDMENMFDLLGTTGLVRDLPAAGPCTLTSGALEFRNVWFAYKPERMILKDVTLQVPGGSSVAFVGPTGAGKSTILRLLFRFYDPVSGTIRLDGKDLKSMTQVSLREQVGVVPQDTVLFNDTIRYNIRYGRPSATDAEVEAAAASASMHTSIMTRFPEQYDTMVGERGLRLSGGEKQRVAFARAILKNPALLVLDEATSSLDSITERDIQTCLKGLKSSRTTVTVAHRLSTIMESDLIVVMADGMIRESGPHHELVTQGGLYSQLWQRQLSSQSVDDLHEEVASPE